MAQLVDNARLTVNDLEILEVDSDPTTGGGLTAKQGAVGVFRNEGGTATAWLKTGPADVDWKKIDVSDNDWSLAGNALAGAEVFGSTNNQDVNFVRNNQAIMSLVNNGVLIGIASAYGGKLDIGASALGDILQVLSSPNGGAGAKVVKISRQYKVQTTDNADTPLATLAIPDDSRLQIEAWIGANQHGGTAGSVGDGADYRRIGSFKRVGGGATALNGRTTPFTEEDDNFFRARLLPTGNNVEISVRGNTDKNLAWSAHVEYMIFQN
jgi:hypothetical protein